MHGVNFKFTLKGVKDTTLGRPSLWPNVETLGFEVGIAIDNHNRLQDPQCWDWAFYVTPDGVTEPIMDLFG